MDQSVHSPDSFVFKTDRPWPNARLKVAAIVGHATESSARVWLRTGRPANSPCSRTPRDAALASSSGEAALRTALSAAPLAARRRGGASAGMRPGGLRGRRLRHRHHPGGGPARA